MSLTTSESVQKLQAALHDKTKKSPNVRSYVLYYRVYGSSFMMHPPSEGGQLESLVLVILKHFERLSCDYTLHTQS